MRSRLFFQPIEQVLWTLLRVVNVLCALGVVGVAIYGVGFQHEDRYMEVLPLIKWTFGLSVVHFAVLVLSDLFERRFNTILYLKIATLAFLLIVSLSWMLPETTVVNSPFWTLLRHVFLLYGIALVQSVVALSVFVTHSLNSKLSPSWIFVGSFLLMILIGTGLLMLPRCTVQPIRFVDALFTAVSSVCVTGLMTLDFVSTFTVSGKFVIIFLAQLGAIGIMTFTSFFGLIFAGKHDSQNKMMVKDLVDPEKGISQIFRTLWAIVLVTFVVEILGAYLIFVSVGGDSLKDIGFALFHSVSAFCNVGLSTVDGGLWNVDLRTNYPLQMIIANLVIVGGLGFPIIFNLGRWLTHSVTNLFRRMFGRRQNYLHIPHLITSNTLIVLLFTALLLVGGTAIFYCTERYNALADLSDTGRWITAFTMSAFPRTAGFSTVDVCGLMPLTVLWLLIFMWIGASPMSTGGGVKTTTIGIAFLNIWHTLRGRDHIELRKRRISETTVNRAFIIIFVSLCLIAIGFILLVWFEPDKPLLPLLFEVVAASSTAGMTMNLTPELCDASRVVILVLMFAGRVGLLTILSCFITPRRQLNYQYPSESIPIN